MEAALDLDQLVDSDSWSMSFDVLLLLFSYLPACLLACLPACLLLALRNLARTLARRLTHLALLLPRRSLLLIREQPYTTTATPETAPPTASSITASLPSALLIGKSVSPPESLPAPNPGLRVPVCVCMSGDAVPRKPATQQVVNWATATQDGR